MVPTTRAGRSAIRNRSWNRACVALGALAVLFVPPGVCQAQTRFAQANLVSSVPNLAQNTDPNLKNPWGISLSGASPFWVSDQVTQKATLYNGFGVPQALVVTIPTNGTANGPTGQVFNSTASDFALGTGGKALFLFANLDGRISGWNGAQGTTSVIVADTPGASYTGLTLGSNGSGNFLYAADSANNRIRAFNATFAETMLSGSFTDPGLPAGFSIYNVQNLGGTLFATFENETSGGGVVDAFDTNGNFLRRVSANNASGPLLSPWGLAIAPGTFGEFAGKLLVGNEDDGRISAFDPVTGAFLGQLQDASGNFLAYTGLWT